MIACRRRWVLLRSTHTKGPPTPCPVHLLPCLHHCPGLLAPLTLEPASSHTKRSTSATCTAPSTYPFACEAVASHRGINCDSKQGRGAPGLTRSRALWAGPGAAATLRRGRSKGGRVGVRAGPGATRLLTATAHARQSFAQVHTWAAMSQVMSGRPGCNHAAHSPHKSSKAPRPLRTNERTHVRGHEPGDERQVRVQQRVLHANDGQPPQHLPRVRLEHLRNAQGPSGHPAWHSGFGTRAPHCMRAAST